MAERLSSDKPGDGYILPYKSLSIVKLGSLGKQGEEEQEEEERILPEMLVRIPVNEPKPEEVEKP